jgi:hypothetical protein
MPKHIGIDLDNTIIDYAPSYKKLGREIGLTDEFCNRASLRDKIRSVNDEAWQKYQSEIYTDGLLSALPADGLIEFLELSLKKGIDISIVSHKTSFTGKKYGGRDLIGPAQNWLKTNGIVPDLISESDIFFCSSRISKIEKITELGCDVFIDDLVEVLSSPELPAKLTKVLFPQNRADDIIADGDFLVMNFHQMTQWLHSC